MNDILSKLTTGEWWFSAIAVALVVNIASSMIFDVLRPRLAKVYGVLLTAILIGHACLCVVVGVLDIWSQYPTLWVIPFILFMSGFVAFFTFKGIGGSTLHKLKLLLNQWLAVGIGFLLRDALYAPSTPIIHVYVSCVVVSSVLAPLTLMIVDSVLRLVAPQYADSNQRD